MWFDVMSGAVPAFDKIGEKATKLLQIHRINIPTPRFGILSFEFLEKHAQHPQTFAAVVKKIQQSIQSWGATKVSIRASLESGDEQLADFAGNLVSKSNVAPQDLPKSLQDFIRELDDPRLLDFFRLHSGGKQRIALIIQETVQSKSLGIFFNQSPTLTSGLHYIEKNTSTQDGTTELSSYWCDASGWIWKSSDQALARHFGQTLQKPLLRYARRLELLKNSNFNFEWIEGVDDQVYVLGFQQGNQEDDVEVFNRLPIKNLLAGPCNNLTIDIYQKAFNDGLEALAAKYFPSATEKKSDWLEFFARRPFLNQKKLLSLLSKFQIEADFAGFDSADSNPESHRKSSLGSLFSKTLRLRSLNCRNRRALENLNHRLHKLIREHSAVLEHAPSSREAARLIANLINEVHGLEPVFFNELMVLESKSLLYKISNREYPNLNFETLNGFKGAISRNTEIYSALQKLAASLAENPAFIEMIRSFLQSSSKTGQSGDIYYWIRENGFHEESTKIHDFLQIYGKTSLIDRRIESPNLSLSPTTFFNIILQVLKNSGLPEEKSGGTIDGTLTMNLSLVRGTLLNFVSKIFFSTLEQRTVFSALVDDYLYFVRSGLRSMANLLQQEAPKLFQDQDAPPDLSVLGIDLLKDYGDGSFGADVLLQMMKRNLKENSQDFNCPDVFFHKRSERDPYFIQPELRPSNTKTHWLLQTLKNDQSTLTGRIRFINDPISLTVNPPGDTALIVSESPIEGIALFLKPNQTGIFSKVTDMDWTNCRLKFLGIHSLILDSLPDRLREDGREVQIRVESDGSVNIS